MTPHDQHVIDLSKFTKDGFSRGRSWPVFAAWLLCRFFFFQTQFPWPSSLKASLLRLFGAKIGANLYIRPGVSIHLPWKLYVGDNVWIGDNCTILNLETVTLESNSALAHEVYLAAGGHDITHPQFAYKNRPIHVSRGVWIGTRALIGPGVMLEEHAIVAAGATVVKSVAEWTVVGGVPAVKIGERRIEGT